MFLFFSFYGNIMRMFRGYLLQWLHRNLRLHCCIMGRLAQMLIEEDSKLKEGDVFLIRFAKVCNYNGTAIV